MMLPDSPSSSGVSRWWCFLGSGFLLVVAIVSVASMDLGTNTSSASSNIRKNGMIVKSYNHVLQDANSVQNALKRQDTVMYFQSTRSFKKSMAELKSLVPEEQLDTRSISKLAWGDTELWSWDFSWWHWGQTKTSTSKPSSTTFLQQVDQWFDKQASSVKDDVDTQYTDYTTDVANGVADVEETAKYVQTHNSEQDLQAAEAFVKKHMDWAKNKLCTMAAGDVFSKTVSAGLTAAGVSTMCTATICPEVLAVVDAIGAGPEDVVADAVAALVTAGCAGVCAGAVSEAVQEVLNEGLKLTTNQGIAKLSTDLCTALSCGPSNKS